MAILNIDIYDVARRAGVGRSTLYKYIQRRPVSREVYDKLRAMGVPQKTYVFLNPKQ